MENTVDLEEWRGDRDTRLVQLKDLATEFANLASEVIKEGGWSQQDVNRLVAARGFVNSAIPYIRKVNR